MPPTISDYGAACFSKPRNLQILPVQHLSSGAELSCYAGTRWMGHMTTEFCQSCSVLFLCLHSQWCWEDQLQKHLAGDVSSLYVTFCFTAVWLTIADSHIIESNSREVYHALPYLMLQLRGVVSTVGFCTWQASVLLQRLVL